MKKILITGKSGSGKSIFSTLLSEYLNCEIIDVDKIGHSVYDNTDISAKVEKMFGKVFDNSNKINSKKLGEIVFKDSTKMLELEKITWPEILRKINDKIKNRDIVIIDWALLPKTELWNDGIKILIDADKKTRNNMVIKRDNITQEYFELREKNCIDYSKYNFDFIIKNNYDINEFRIQAQQVAKLIKEM